MRYAQIRSMDISNGEGVGVALFVQGCHFHCEDCFNQETWDFNGGQEWTNKEKNLFMHLLNEPYITRCSILGGEPLTPENVETVLDLIVSIRLHYPKIKIWLYTGYKFEQLIWPVIPDDFNPARDRRLQQIRKLISLCDVVIDGRYKKELRDVSLHWCGSSNQRVIDVQQTLAQNKIILYEDNK